MIDLIPILTKVPENTVLYSVVHGKVKFKKILINDVYCIRCVTCDESGESQSTTFNKYGQLTTFNKYGQLYDEHKEGECVLFPSKENRDWNNFCVIEEEEPVLVLINEHDIIWQLAKHVDKNTVCFPPNTQPVKVAKQIPVTYFDYETFNK